MMALLENGSSVSQLNGVLTADKQKTVQHHSAFNSLNGSNFGANTNTLFANLDEGPKHAQFTSFSNGLMSNGKDHNTNTSTNGSNNFFHFEQPDHSQSNGGNNTNLLDYDYFNRFNGLVEMKTNTGNC